MEANSLPSISAYGVGVGQGDVSGRKNRSSSVMNGIVKVELNDAMRGFIDSPPPD
jgi:hypothetical protein